MRQNRRQDLRTNELSEQLEQMGTYAKQNATSLAVTIIVAVAVVGGVWYYLHHRNTTLLTGWATLYSATDNLAPGASPMAAYESVAEADLNSGLTAQALLLTGKAAIEKLQNVDAPPATQPANEVETDWGAKAEGAFAKIMTRFPNDTTAVGPAMILTGVVCEGRRDYAKAREWYQKVMDDPRFAHTPFKYQADYRLKHLDRWMKTIVFAPPLHTVPEPPPAPPAPAEAPVQPSNALPGSAQPLTIQPVTPPPAAALPAPSASPPTAPPAGAAPTPGGVPSPTAAPSSATPAQPSSATPAQPTGNVPPPAGAVPGAAAGGAPNQPTSAPSGG